MSSTERIHGTGKMWQGSIDPELEGWLVEDVSVDAAWALVEQFSSLVRVSGSEGERQAADHILERLRTWGIPYQRFEPELYVSVPVSAEVEVRSPATESYPAKTPAFSISTGGAGLRGEVIYVPRETGSEADSLYHPSLDDPAQSVAGKIVLTEGLSGPDEVTFFADRGSVGQIFVNPGERIHWSICTPIWGSPDLDSIDGKPTVVVADVSRRDGERLIQLAQQGPLHVVIRTELQEGWLPCPLIVTEVRGTLEPDKFLLVHSHLDSWDVGVGDNATGNGALLELARLLWRHRVHLKRSVRFAWWPAHSTGRYAGSTWYADTFAQDIIDNCIAHLNIDSPGCRWADTYSHVCWMSEAATFCREVIRDVTGQEAEGVRPYRAGDYSFNNLGVTGFFMLLSEMSKEKQRELGYYPVGGCGGNIGWHTEDDTLDIADRVNLERDIKVYAVAIARLVNASVYPLDFVQMTREMRASLRDLQHAGGGQFDLSPSLDAVEALESTLQRFYQDVGELGHLSAGDVQVQRTNEVLLSLARMLVTLNYSRHGRFRQDPALDTGPLPDLAPIQRFGSLPPGSSEYRLCRTQLVRGQNRIVYTLRQAQRLVERTLAERG
jgi:hypothetical protein